jgi:hypothetical protein
VTTTDTTPDTGSDMTRGTGSSSTAQPVTATAPDAGRAVATLLAALMGFFVVTLDAVIVNVALPDIGADLGGASPDCSG